MRLLLIVAALLVVAPPAGALEIEWVYIGNAGNLADAATGTDNCGPDRDLSCAAVSYNYYISKYEVTKAQYVEFLNTKAAADPLGLYHEENMGFIGISRSGASGSFTYSVQGFLSNQPVSAISFYQAVRFANWLSNGHGFGFIPFIGEGETSRTDQPGTGRVPAVPPRLGDPLASASAVAERMTT